ncbi:MAG: ABC transporter permease [Alphaproteobacteria bacterium]|nr:ABC transporter permease [Alphaproteobacteria bacterium]
MRQWNQISAVTMMNLRSIPQRIWQSLSTVVSVGIVVGVLLAFQALGNGFQETVRGTGSDNVAIFLRSGSESELNSTVTREQVQLLSDAPGIAAGADGQPALSGELYVIVDGIKRSSGTKANVPLRGVGAKALEVRDGVRIVEGRMLEPGRNELVVGRGVAKEFEGFDFGSTIRLGTSNWEIVGVFEAGGSVFESEVWADTAIIQGVFQRGSTVQSVRVRLSDPASGVQALKAFSEGDPRLKLDVQSERSYFAGQAQGFVNIIFYLGWPLAIAMSFGALAGALNTMYSSVDARMRDIATLRAIGFGGFPAFAGTMVEALLLASIGGVIGAVATWALFSGLTASTLGGGFTQVVFGFSFTPMLIVEGLLLALVIGFLGGFLPAIRAARIPLLAAFRDA